MHAKLASFRQTLATDPDDPTANLMIGKYVCYEVADDGFEIREATRAEVEAHVSELRPTEKQTPRRDLSITSVKPLDEIGFGDAAAQLNFDPQYMEKVKSGE